MPTLIRALYYNLVTAPLAVFWVAVEITVGGSLRERHDSFEVYDYTEQDDDG